MPIAFIWYMFFYRLPVSSMITTIIVIIISLISVSSQNTGKLAMLSYVRLRQAPFDNEVGESIRETVI